MLPMYRALRNERRTIMTQNHQRFQRNQQRHTSQPQALARRKPLWIHPRR